MAGSFGFVALVELMWEHIRTVKTMRLLEGLPMLNYVQPKFGRI